MNSTISFQKHSIKMGALGQEASVPDLTGGIILQNKLKFYLGEEEELFEGYGRRRNSYPYRQFSCYTGQLEERELQTVILENEYLKAVFLPEFGGRLWSLWDKKENRNLLYTNHVIRFRNLAVRNAWFSGGVEWNIGLIGHSPFTTAPLFCAVLENQEKGPVLRMYEYERVRQVTYQMDFWLGERDRFLNARMRIVNSGTEVVPMYWWSNIAVPEKEKGRIIVPAEKAYTFRDGGVYKVDIPMVDGVDISRYKKIPVSVDYFFDIPQESPKYIAHVDENGYGLLHLSTSRLKSRKLFSWGSKQAAGHWQEFLTDGGGNYLEIQAGLGKTQYGCVPMAPHTAWEWLERYGAINLLEDVWKAGFEDLREKVTKRVLGDCVYQEMEQVLSDTKKMAKEKAQVHLQGSGYGALKNQELLLAGEPVLPEHLDFGIGKEEKKQWIHFLETGILPDPDPASPPDDFMVDEVFFRKLLETIEGQNKDNWYAHYHLGLFYFQKEEYKMAEKEFHASICRKENPWAYHGAAAAGILLQDREGAGRAMRRGLEIYKGDLSYIKEGFRLLILSGRFEDLIKIYQGLPTDIQEESRVRFYYIQALWEKGEAKEAYSLLCQNGGLVVEDIREGEIALGDLWQNLHEKLYGEKGEVPYCFDFTAI